MPEFVAKRPARYRGKRLKDLCGEMHAFFRDAGVSELQQAQFAAKHLPEAAMTPREAARHLVRNNVDYLPLAELDGRIATTLWVVYPPGIATIVPGETADGAGAADDRLSENVREERQRVPRLRSGSAGPLSRGRRKGSDPVPYLCGQGDACLKPPLSPAGGILRGLPAPGRRPRALRGVTIGLDFA